MRVNDTILYNLSPSHRKKYLSIIAIYRVSNSISHLTTSGIGTHSWTDRWCDNGCTNELTNQTLQASKLQPNSCPIAEKNIKVPRMSRSKNLCRSQQRCHRAPRSTPAWVRTIEYTVKQAVFEEWPPRYPCISEWTCASGRG